MLEGTDVGSSVSDAVLLADSRGEHVNSRATTYKIKTVTGLTGRGTRCAVRGGGRVGLGSAANGCACARCCGGRWASRRPRGAARRGGSVADERELQAVVGRVDTVVDLKGIGVGWEARWWRPCEGGASIIGCHEKKVSLHSNTLARYSRSGLSEPTVKDHHILEVVFGAVLQGDGHGGSSALPG